MGSREGRTINKHVGFALVLGFGVLCGVWGYGLCCGSFEDNSQ